MFKPFSVAFVLTNAAWLILFAVLGYAAMVPFVLVCGGVMVDAVRIRFRRYTVGVPPAQLFLYVWFLTFLGLPYYFAARYLIWRGRAKLERDV